MTPLLLLRAVVRPRRKVREVVVAETTCGHAEGRQRLSACCRHMAGQPCNQAHSHWDAHAASVGHDCGDLAKQGAIAGGKTAACHCDQATAVHTATGDRGLRRVVAGGAAQQGRCRAQVTLPTSQWSNWTGQTH